MRLLKRLYQVAGPMYGVHENVFAVAGENGITLIDSGLDDRDYEVVMRNLRYWELDRLPVRHVLLTHAHCEHSGNAWRFAAEGAVICAHKAAAAAVERGDDRTAVYAFFGHHGFHCCPVGRKMDDGEVIGVDGAKLRVLHVPGHSAGSVVYRMTLDDRSVMFTGDTILAERVCRQSRLGWSGGVDYCREQYMKSLERLAAMETDLLLPGHGELCLRDGTQMLIGAYLRGRLELANRPVAEPAAGWLGRGTVN